MAARKVVGYYRVSTKQQGDSGLGLEAQKRAVHAFLVANGDELIAEFTEVETGKGAAPLSKRPQLAAALALAKKQRATLVIAKLDRLSRNLHFVTGLIESGVDFVAADLPFANKMMIQIHAVMAEYERDAISSRTKAALAAARARGVVLGRAGPSNLRPNVEQRQRQANDFAERLRGLVEGFRARGLRQREMIAELTALGIRAPRGGGWSFAQLQRLLAQIRGVPDRQV